MPTGPFGEILGSTGTMDNLPDEVKNYKSKVVAPKNPKLIKGSVQQQQHKLTPSKFLFDISMTTEQRLNATKEMRNPVKIELLDMGDTSLQKFSLVGLDDPIFQPFPCEIYFQRFVPCQTYEVNLILRNNDKIPRLVKVTQADSPYFKIISPLNCGAKVGAGLPITFKVIFTPQQNKDYFHELVCITEREKFIVPVRAIGARGILDFPDKIHFPAGPVKYTNSKTVLVRNIGDKTVTFSLYTDKPFTVTPCNGVVPVGDSLQITVDFTPVTTGDHKTDMRLQYDTGESILIELYGAAQDCNVRLDKNSLIIENTYISMANQRTVSISNRSDVITHFRWTNYATAELEEQCKHRLFGEIDQQKEAESDAFAKQCAVDPMIKDRIAVLERTFKSMRQKVHDNDMLFADDVIAIEPSVGDIWPHSSMDVTVIFKPKEAITYNHTAFCDITGRESRLPLRIKGQGIGPRVKFSYDTLDMGNIFIGSRHTYEVVLSNKGDIDAVFCVQPKPSTFGSCFTFTPAEGIVLPGGYQAIKVTFVSYTLGDFSELFSFKVDGLQELVKVTFTGTVIGPTFYFNVPKLKFGVISYGFMSTKQFTIFNTSLIPMEFSLRVPDDGQVPSINAQTEILPAYSNRRPFSSSPREFEIIPNQASLEPLSSMKFIVNFTSNSVKKYKTAICVDVKGVGNDILSLPLSATCVIPNLSIANPIIDFGRCFLRYPYEQRIKIHNETDLPAKYELIPQTQDDGDVILYRSAAPEGVIEARSSIELPIEIMVQQLEENELLAKINVFGSIDIPLAVHVLCIGEGPVVHLSPNNIDYGMIPVLTDVNHPVVLSNESLIPATFTASMVRGRSVFHVFPMHGIIPPTSCITIVVTAFLNDVVRFQDRLIIDILESDKREIPLCAYGKGTTIVSDPPLTNILDLGPNFSNRPLQRTFTLTNKGRRHQQLAWSTEGYPWRRPVLPKITNTLDVNYKNQKKPLEPPQPIFKLSPQRMELPPGESVTMTFDGFVDRPQYVKEHLMCHAIIGRQGGKELIISTNVFCEFINPLINFSSKNLYFRFDKHPTDTLHKLVETLELTNVSSLCLCTFIQLNHPFALVIDGERVTSTSVDVEVGTTHRLDIEFDPAYIDNCHMRSIDEYLRVSYKEHPHMDSILLHGEVYFPNVCFEHEEIDFGCVLNDTEVTRYVNMTNNSPMTVKYKWSFLVEDEEACVTFSKPSIIHKPATSDEEIPETESQAQINDMQLVNIENMENMENMENVENVALDEESEAVAETMEGNIQGSGNEMTSQLTSQQTSQQTSQPRSSNVPELLSALQQLSLTQLKTIMEVQDNDKDIDETENGRHPQEMASDSTSVHSTATASNIVLKSLLETNLNLTPPQIEEVFDILPLYGMLEPGESEHMTFTFYGHANIKAKVKAICEVEGGPTYELNLSGRASLVAYELSNRTVDLQKEMFDQVAVAEVTLYNLGQVGFDFTTLYLDPCDVDQPQSGVPVVIPHSGHLEANSEVTLEIRYIPGVPEVFHKTIHLQVAHYPADIIHLHGEGVFPRISLDLPRLPDNSGIYKSLSKLAQENLGRNLNKDSTDPSSLKLNLPCAEEPDSPKSEDSQDKVPGDVEEDVKMAEGDSGQSESKMNDAGSVTEESQPSELQLQMEVERLVVKEFSTDLIQRDHKSIENLGKRKKIRPRLPDYILDFGFVVMDSVRNHIVRITNTGYFPVSFSIDKTDIAGRGFVVLPERVKNLPGAPDHETVDFLVTFDPQAANLPLGYVNAVVPINIVGGPQLCINMCATVTMPDMQVSADALDFENVKCGECKIMTVQLHNHQQVTCEWMHVPKISDCKQYDKHMPMHLRRKIKPEKKKPPCFEVIPSHGMLYSGQRINIQVKFMPAEEKVYSEVVMLKMNHSSQRIVITCQGNGLEPKLLFEKNLLEFSPVLPHSAGSEQEIVVTNPCSFPIEFYNLEFDRQYLEEELILRLMKGYDEHETLLLPPRKNTGDKLPVQLLDYYDEQVRKLEEQERREKQEMIEARKSAEGRLLGDLLTGEKLEEPEVRMTVTPVPPETSIAGTPLPGTPTPTTPILGTPRPLEMTASKPADGLEVNEEKLKESSESDQFYSDLDLTPVAAAIGEYLGIDLTPEGKAARNRRGIVILVNGSPKSGKSHTALYLSQKYNAALLTIDGIVIDAIVNGNTTAGLQAREMCMEAARRVAEGDEGDDGEKRQAAGGLSVEAVTAHAAGTSGVASGKGRLGGPNDKKDKLGSLAGTKTIAGLSSTDGGPSTHGLSHTTPPLLIPPRKLSVELSIAGEDGLMSCILPEDLLIELIADRLQLNDCQKGVIIDGLDTIFSQTLTMSAYCVLKASNNRRFLYMISLKQTYNKYKEREMKEQIEQAEMELRAKEAEKRHLEEMSEEEYDRLSEEEKAIVDEKHLAIKKERIKRETEERMERERREQLAFEEEQKRLEEEKAARKRGKKVAEKKEEPKKGGKQAGTSQDKIHDKKAQKGHDDHAPKTNSNTERPDSHYTERSDTDGDMKKKKSVAKDAKKGDGKDKCKEGDKIEWPAPEDVIKDANEQLFINRFRNWELCLRDISDLMDHWDRTNGQICRPPTPSERSDPEQDHPASGRKKKLDKHEKEKIEKEKERLRELERIAKEAQASSDETQGSQTQEEGTTEPEEKPEIRNAQGELVGVPHMVLDVSTLVSTISEKLEEMEKLPPLSDVLDGLGMGPHGPPVPPPAVFGIVPYPVKRRPPTILESGGHYSFLSVGLDEGSTVPGDETRRDVTDDENLSPDIKDDHGSGKKSRIRERKKSAMKSTRVGGRRSSIGLPSPPPNVGSEKSDADNISIVGEQSTSDRRKASIFRWSVAPFSQTIIRVKFHAEELGQYDQTMNFELVGTRRRYQVFCRGVCTFPNISKEPRIVFPCRKKYKKPDEIVHKKYILLTETFEFGPLLAGKPRDRYRELRYAENVQKITIKNTSAMEAEVNFCFLHDSKADTFLLEPAMMKLEPQGIGVLTVWAYPKTPHHFVDEIVCCIRENPEPVTFKLSCDGVRPELELDKRQFLFEKVLLHRKACKTIYLRNSTLLPVAWKLSGLENLGDDFSVATDYGIIAPKSEYALNAYFRAMKPVTQVKKTIRLEVSDVENIIGIIQPEVIQVMAEAYDVALDLSFPKGTDGGLDFGVTRVGEEAKLVCTLKNKGKYEIGFMFVIEGHSTEDISSLISIMPPSGLLSPTDRPTQIHAIFKSKKELVLKESPLIKCQVIEPNMGDGGETIASIPVKVSAKATYSKFSILPMDDINFGPMVITGRKSRTITIENKGDFEFKYSISRYNKEMAALTNIKPQKTIRQDRKNPRSRDGSGSITSIMRTRRTESIRAEAGPQANQSRLVIGAFTIFPAFGIVLPNGHQIINVDCFSENKGRFDEEISIEISDRQPGTHPGGIVYKLLAEGCLPGVSDDVSVLFEEHRIVKNLSHVTNLSRPSSAAVDLSTVETGGVFGEDERKFVFRNVNVGHKAKCRFKIANPDKVACDVMLMMKPVGKAKSQDIFEVEPPRAQIMCHSYIYATVTFMPQLMQSYSAIFEAQIDNLPLALTRGRNLTFEVTGEGNLPCIQITKPTLRNKRGQGLMLFKKTLVGRSQTLPLVIHNDGNLLSKVHIDLIDPDSVFTLNLMPSVNTAITHVIAEEKKKVAHTASIMMKVGESAEMEIVYKPGVTQRSQAHVRLTVVDNQYEDTVVQLVAESYTDSVSIDNIRGSLDETEEMEGCDETIQAAKCNLINFGDIHINEPRTITFSMVNHSTTDIYRFVWPELEYVTFSPQVGHLHPASTKDISAIFKIARPIDLTEELIECQAIIIKMDPSQASLDIMDWDDRVKTVKWVDIPITPVQTSDTGSKSSPTPVPTAPVLPRPRKKKVTECETEPSYMEVAETNRKIDLYLTARAQYCDFKCKAEQINFRDTLMFQNCTYSFQVQNTSKIRLDYSWQVVMDNLPANATRSVTFYSDADGSIAPSLQELPPDIPFSIEPEYGFILPGVKQRFTAMFSPLHVQEYEGRLICSIPNLESQQGPVIGIRARSVMPICHFELQDSDYLSNSRRNPELRGPGGAAPGTKLDSNIRVLEFNVVGIKATSFRTFSIINPTQHTLNFTWVTEDVHDIKAPISFRCLTPAGQIQPGKKTEVPQLTITFEFVSHKLEIDESFWRFAILEQNITVPFLLVGSTKEPDIMMDRSHHNFKALLLGTLFQDDNNVPPGHEATETIYLLNNEDEPFSFEIVEESCHTVGYISHLFVSPMSGVIEPKSRFPLDIHFTATLEKEVNFNMLCKVKRKVTPIQLNVKAEGFTMSCAVVVEGSSGVRVELVADAINEIQFGNIEINEVALRNVFITNTGKFNFNYKWDVLGGQGHKRAVSITPKNGAVPVGERQKSIISFTPSKRMTLRSELSLLISNGPTYTIILTGQAVTPGLDLSFTSHDFGPCFIHHAGLPENHAVLTLSNNDNKDLSVECLYTPSKHLHYTQEPTVIPAGKSIDVTFTFYPREAIKYHDVVTLRVNGLYNMKVEFFGQGTEMKIEVVDPKHRKIHLGHLTVNKSVKRYVPIVNHSHAPLTFHLSFMPTTPQLQGTNLLTILPSNQITLAPKGGTCRVEVVFNPTIRVPKFTEEVVLEGVGLSRPLFVMTGSCLGMEISLDMESVPFGAVTLKSSSTRTVIMYNTGDINARFVWDAEKFLPDFRIDPLEGYLTPGSELAFEVTFNPPEINGDIRYDNIPCHIYGGPHKPVCLTLTGMCTAIPPVKESANFTTVVRQKDIKTINISNKTNSQWRLKPIIDGEYWNGPVMLTVDPQVTKGYELTYHPLTMTVESRKHCGSIFFPLPDGTGIMYNLTGTADPPKPNARIQRDVPCKTHYTELLSVSNWLKKPQRFRARIELIKGDKSEVATTVKGMEYIDVPAHSKSDFKLSFHAFKEGITPVKVVFINETNGEYQFYEINFRATKPGVIGTIDLTTPVRQSASHVVTIDNPLNVPVTLTPSYNIPELMMPTSFNIPPLSEGSFTLEYQPLKVGEVTGKLDFHNFDLGNFTYELRLNAMPAGPEKTIHFMANLGTSQVITARFLNYAKTKTDYACRIESSEFTVDKSIAAAPGSIGGLEVALDVTFEPSKLGEHRSLLTLLSPIGGEYQFPLVGSCVPPKPQGPFIIKSGSSTPIVFRNVFSQSSSFSFHVDNPLFHLTKGNDTIRSKKDYRIIVGFDGNDTQSKAPVMGKLIVMCPRSAGVAANIQWVYYLKGITPT